MAKKKSDSGLALVLLYLLFFPFFIAYWLFRIIYDLATAPGKRRAEEAAKQARWEALHARFGQEVALRIWQRQLQQGDSREVVEAIYGYPVAVDEKVSKTKVKHTLKYQQIAVNRYAVKIELENNVVTGWEH